MECRVLANVGNETVQALSSRVLKWKLIGERFDATVQALSSGVLKWKRVDWREI